MTSPHVVASTAPLRVFSVFLAGRTSGPTAILRQAIGSDERADFGSDSTRQQAFSSLGRPRDGTGVAAAARTLRWWSTALGERFACLHARAQATAYNLGGGLLAPAHRKVTSASLGDSRKDCRFRAAAARDDHSSAFLEDAGVRRLSPRGDRRLRRRERKGATCELQWQAV